SLYNKRRTHPDYLSITTRRSSDLVLGHLPQIIGELLALGTELAEAVHERRMRTARRVGVAHCEFQLYQETGSEERLPGVPGVPRDRKSTRLNSSHGSSSYAVFCLT